MRQWVAIVSIALALLVGDVAYSMMNPRLDFVFSLVMFNLGVELGQLLVLAAAFLVLGWWRKAAFFKSRIAQPASVSIAGVGLFWLIKRAVLS